MSDSFADRPVSLAETKAMKEHNGALWSPRDALLAVLRDIDSGKLNVDTLIVMMRYKESEEASCGFVIASPDSDATIATIERARYTIRSHMMHTC